VRKLGKRVMVAAASTVALVLLLLGFGALLGCCVFSAETWHGPVAPHFDGERFHDDKPHRAGASDMIKWTSTRKPGPWPEWIDAQPGPPPPRVVEGAGLRVTFINHATTLVQMDGVDILTDPIWADRASPVGFAGPHRVRPPGIRFEDLPPIDVVVLSHNHDDHMNVETLQRLRDAFHPIVIAGLGNAAFLASQGIEAKEVDWGDVVTVKGLRIHSVPNQHFSNRGLCDSDGTLWSAYVSEGDHAGRAYFAGDTGYGQHFHEVGQKFHGLRLAILPIGAYKPEWFMGPVHETPAQAVQAQLDLGARVAVGMHFGTFPLADDGIDEPVRDLLTALDQHHPAPEFWVLGFGEGRDVP
jgi:L-ascorbate metabolism protein UlaG (beta-lactamase superfamily)